MIHKEIIEINGVFFDRVYSDLSVYIKKIKLGGNEEIYSEVYDPYEFHDIRSYEETDLPIDNEK